METENYRRLTFQERVIIETLLNQKKKKAFIAKQLNRSRSTIGREVNPWGNKPGSYNAELANWCAVNDYENKHKVDKISTYPKLKSYVYKMLEKKWAPEQIAGRIKIKYPGDKIMSISHEAIYMHIYRQPQGKENKRLIALLPYHKSR
jgi:transposase, IS30 family